MQPHRKASSGVPVAGTLVVLATAAGLVSAPAEDKTAAAVRTEQAPSLDGSLDAGWGSARVISDFHQREPFEGQDPTEKTRVRVLYDSKRLYFGIECFDRSPQGIVATELRRDTDFTVDDYFSILISPNNDGRTGYIFTVNPLGTQFDSTLTDEGRVKNPNWDGIWISRARITSEGWTATVVIPFSTLNFKSSENVTLGLNFLRFVRRKNEEDLWKAYLRIYGLERVSEAGELTDVREIGSGRLLLVKPYVLGGFVLPQGEAIRAQHRGGFDVKYGLRSNLVANVTVNTDFADVDVDPLRFNITPFKIFLPEKRPFFLENSGFFEFGNQDTNQLFFSRQIGIDPISGQEVPIDAGAKVTGSLGDYDIGLLEVHTREEGPNPAANYAVARLRRRLFSESFVGVLMTDKESTNALDQYNRAAGVDSHFVFAKQFSVDSFFTQTFSPGVHGRNWSDSIRADYKSNLIQAEYRHSDVQPNYNPEVGFVDRVDLVTNFADVNIAPRPKRGPIRELNFEAFVDREPDTHGVLQTQEWQTTFRALFHNGAYTDDDLFDNFIQRLNAPFNIFGKVVIPAGLYHFDRHQLTYGADQSKRFVYSFFERFGTYYNGRLNEFRVRAKFHPTPRLAVEGFETWDRFRFPDGIHNVHVNSWNTSYSFSRFLTSSFLVQVNSVDKNPVSVNVRVRYTYRPDSDLFVVYTLGSQFNSIAAGNPVLRREARLTVKLTYSFLR